MPVRQRLGLALSWLALLLLAGAWIGQSLPLSGDLRAFMPAPRTPAQHLLLDELGEGPGTRVLLVGIDGAAPEVLAVQSEALRAALADDTRFDLVANGQGSGLAAIPEALRPYRYLLTATFDAQPLDSALLGAELQARVQDLGSPAAALVEPLVPADPTLETLALAEAWAPTDAPRMRHGVWFNATGERALLLVQTDAAGFDPAAQAGTVAAVRDAFHAVRGDTGSRMALGGPGVFSVEIAGRTRLEAAVIGGLGTAIFVLLLVLNLIGLIFIIGSGFGDVAGNCSLSESGDLALAADNVHAVW